MSESKDEVRRPERSGGNPEKRQRRDNRSAAKGIPRSTNGATRDAGQKIQRQLDDALADSFPASDPVSIVTSNEEEDWGEAPDPATEGNRSPEEAPEGRPR